MGRFLRNIRNLKDIAEFQFVDCGLQSFDPRRLLSELEPYDFEFRFKNIDKNINDHHRKLLYVLENCQTEFVMRIDNDDLVDSENILRLIEIIKSDASCVAIRGHVSGFVLNGPLPYGSLIGITRNYHPDNEMKDLKCESSSDRLSNAFSEGGVEDYYSIWRRSPLLKIYSGLNDINFSWGHPFPEMLFHVLATLSGPILHVPGNFYLFRQANTSLRHLSPPKIKNLNAISADDSLVREALADFLNENRVSLISKQKVWAWYEKRKTHELMKFQDNSGQMKNHFEAHSTNSSIDFLRGHFMNSNKKIISKLTIPEDYKRALINMTEYFS